MEYIFVRFPDATWTEDAFLGVGIAKLKPTYVVWALDKGWTQLIERCGFTIASDFSGTAHSFQGSNLPAAIIDCGEWDSRENQPSKKEQWLPTSNRSRRVFSLVLVSGKSELYGRQDHPYVLYPTGSVACQILLRKLRPRKARKATSS